jgi:SAM-dependent methyltransferase
MDLFLKKNGYTIRRCPSCGLLMTDFHKPYEPFIKTFYQKGYFTGDPAYGAYSQYEEDKRFVQKNMYTILTRILRFTSSGRLLDVGCAHGFFVELALSRGFDAYGFDPSSYAISQAHKFLNGRLKESSIAGVSYPNNSFDILCAFDVVEHLKDPIADLKKLHTLLIKNGLMVISTGNIESTAARILGSRWTFYNPPQHLMYFSKKTLSRVLDASGFEPVEWFGIRKWLSLGYILHLAYSAAGIMFAAGLKKLVQRIGIESLPVYIPLRDNMIVIARKK